jgi:effector-binding domain-containing protein
MDYVVRVETVAPRQLAVARATTARANLGRSIIELLDKVWPVLRAQQVRTGHNVVIYFDGQLRIEAGVEIFDPFTMTGDVYTSATPAGETLTTTHWGEYADVGGAYAALERWCVEHGRRVVAPSWEVYGDWSETPEGRRMDVYQLLRPG